MRAARTLGGLLTAILVLSATSARGQGTTYTMPPPALPPASAPPAGAMAPALPAPGMGPTATFDGNIQLPPPQWDPYATPGTQTPSLLPQDPYISGPSMDSFYGQVAEAKRFLQELRFEYTFIPGNGLEDFSINTMEGTATFAIPFFYNRQTPLLITPGFAVNYWSGPRAPGYDLPPNSFDAYLDTAWNPQPTPWLGGELGVRIGVYSDFRKVTTESLRYMGHGLAVLSFTPSMKLKFGVMYLDRNRVKLLPAGGVVWSPNSDTVLEILFPNPRLARRIINIGNTEWWLYARGEYGGGAWTVRRDSGSFESIDYNDIRFAVGLDFQRHGGLRGFFESGIAFDREIIYKTTQPKFHPRPAYLLRAGLIY